MSKCRHQRSAAMPPNLVPPTSTNRIHFAVQRSIRSCLFRGVGVHHALRRNDDDVSRALRRYMATRSERANRSHADPRAESFRGLDASRAIASARRHRSRENRGRTAACRAGEHRGCLVWAHERRSTRTSPAANAGHARWRLGGNPAGLIRTRCFGQPFQSRIVLSIGCECRDSDRLTASPTRRVVSWGFSWPGGWPFLSP
jgi:hypothetical protein